MVVHPTHATKKGTRHSHFECPVFLLSAFAGWLLLHKSSILAFQRPPESASYIEKIKKRKLNYAAMRADGELPREEYQALCKQADDEIARLEQELKALSPAPEPQTVSSDMKAIYDFLSQKKKKKFIVHLTSFSYVLLRLKGFITTVTPAPAVSTPMRSTINSFRP